LIAGGQTAGRGPAGGDWLSAPGKSLTFSLAWKFALPTHALVGLPLAVGVALADALSMFDVKVELKWPNDVLHEGRKLAGILIETAAAGKTPDANWAVIGIGLNLALDDDVAARIGRPVASAPRLAEPDQNLLAATLVSRLAETLLQFEQQGLAAFLPRWNALHAYAGQPVVLLDQGRVLHDGIAIGIDPIGRLLLDTAHGRVAVMAGDVSLRIKEG